MFMVLINPKETSFLIRLIDYAIDAGNCLIIYFITFFKNLYNLINLLFYFVLLY